MDGYYDYDKKKFIEIMYSMWNEDENNPFYVDLSISFRIRPFENGIQDNTSNLTQQINDF